jgi:integrase/recombinase XerD
LDLADTTQATYRHYFALFAEFIGSEQNIEKVTSRDVTRFLTHLSKVRGLSDRSVHDVRIMLSSLWTWASKEFGIEHVVAKVPKPSYKKPEIIPYTRREAQQLLDAVEYDKQWRTRNGRIVRSKRATALRDKAIILTLVDTGIRASELCALTATDYDERRGRLHILHGKGDKGRFTVMGKRTQKALWKYLSTRAGRKPTAPLFATGDGGPMSRSSLLHMIQGAGRRSGIDGANVHRFRHTFAINFLRNGGNVFELQELLGHEDIRTLTIYVRMAEQDIDAAGRHSPADNWRL